MTIGVLVRHLMLSRDPTASRRAKRKARVAWLLLRRKRARWHSKGEWTMVNQRRRWHRAEMRKIEKLRAELEHLRSLMPLRVSA